MFCPRCGKDVTGKRFCSSCGLVVEEAQTNQNGAAINIPRENNADNKESGWITIVAVLVIMVMILVVVVLFFVFKSVSTQNNAAPFVTTVQTAPNNSQNAQQQTEEKKEEKEFKRMPTYSSSYMYKNMGPVHSSVEASDADSHILTDVVRSFNNSWINYVNTGNKEVFNYLKSGTAPYRYAVSYGRKNIFEEYVLMEFYDVRQSGDSYYIWSHEIIKELNLDTNKVRNKEYHWVYRVTASGGGYYIENYISDPAYK